MSQLRLRASGHACVSLLAAEMKKMRVAGSTCLGRPSTAAGQRKAVGSFALLHMEERTSLCHPRVLHPAGGFPHLLVGGGGCQASSSSWTPVQAKKQMVPIITCCSDPLYTARAHLGMHQPCLSLSDAPSQLGEACPQPVWWVERAAQLPTHCLLN